MSNIMMEPGQLQTRVLGELVRHPRSIVQLTHDLSQPPWAIFRAVHQLNRLGYIAYAPGRGQWCLASPEEVPSPVGSAVL